MVDLVELVTGKNINLAYLFSIIGLVSGLLGIFSTTGNRVIDRLLYWLGRLRVVMFIGSTKEKEVSAIVTHEADGTINAKPDPEPRYSESRTNFGCLFALHQPPWVRLVRYWSSTGVNEFHLVTAERVEASPLLYTPMGVAAMTWLVIASVLHPSWLLLPFKPWLLMASQWSSIQLEFPSLLVHLILGLIFLVFAYFTSVIYLSLSIVAPVRIIGGFAEYAHRRWSPKWYRGLLALLLVLGFITGTTAA